MSGINDQEFYETTGPDPISGGGSFDAELNTDSGSGDAAAAAAAAAAIEHLSPEEQAALENEWRQELEKTDEEIATLRQVLTWKMRKSNELKRKLGITVWKEVTGDIKHSWASIRESNTYQKTTSVARTAKAKTSTTMSSFTSRLGGKIGDLRNSTAFKGVEERVGSAYLNVKQNVMGKTDSKTAENFESSAAEEAIDMTNDDAPPQNNSSNGTLPS